MNKIQTRLKSSSPRSFLATLHHFCKIACASMMVLAVITLTSCKDSSTDANAKIEVAAAVETLNNAIVDPNEELLKSITLPQLTYGHSSGVIQDQQEFMDQLLNGDFDFVSVSTSDQTIHVSGNTAIVRHILSIEGNNAGKPASVRIGIMLTFQKQGGNWLLLARQAYKL